MENDGNTGDCREIIPFYGVVFLPRNMGESYGKMTAENADINMQNLHWECTKKSGQRRRYFWDLSWDLNKVSHGIEIRFLDVRAMKERKYIHINIHTYRHTHTYTYIYIYIHIHIHSHIDICRISIYIYVYVCILYVRTCTVNMI